MKRILGIGIYKSGDLTYEFADLTDLNVRFCGREIVFTGHATVKSLYKGKQFSNLYQLTRVYIKRRGKWEAVASKRTRVAPE
jgi:hypothetical protein